MGTLTGNVDRLAGYCEHKLPTSCRLTSILNCCACADERGHSATYRTYIDGIGYVSRGTRWQRYCWFCKEFWSNRVSISGMTPEQSRIPLEPDQTEFLDKWYEFHRGYRIVKQDDGTETRVAVLGEPFPNVAPGDLPRTLDELRDGAQRSNADQQQSSLVTAIPQAATRPSLDETLDQLMIDADTEVTDTPRAISNTSRAQRLATDHLRSSGRPSGQDLARVVAVHRKLRRTREGLSTVITELRGLGDHVSDSLTNADHLEEMQQVLDDILQGLQAASESSTDTSSGPDQLTNVRPQRGLHAIEAMRDAAGVRRREARTRLANAERTLSSMNDERMQAMSMLDAINEEFSMLNGRLERIRREHSAMESFRRLHGTLADVQSADYVAPLTGMFDRAWQWHDRAQQTVREQDIIRQVVNGEEQVLDSVASQIADIVRNGSYSESTYMQRIAQGPSAYRRHDIMTVTSDGAQIHPDSTAALANAPTWNVPMDFPIHPATDPVIRAVPPSSSNHMHPLQSASNVTARLGLDVDDTRPEPLPEAELSAQLECKVCLTQLASMACLPCGHLAMCEWCAEQVCPTSAADRTRPIDRGIKCPVCRRAVKSRVRVRLP